jgi:Na+-translocating ferredoxin:NAD+ oxidoreductase subunit G
MINNKEIVKIAANLVAVYIVGGLILVSAYAFTKPIIDRNQDAKMQRELKKLIPGGQMVNKLGDWEICDRQAGYYAVAKDDGSLCGYVIESYGKGYSSFIHTLLGVDSTLHIIKIAVIGHAETPGLGDGVETPWFQDQFRGKGLTGMEVIKRSDPEKIQALTGATISSRAVVNAEHDALTFLTTALRK